MAKCNEYWEEGNKEFIMYDYPDQTLRCYFLKTSVYPHDDIPRGECVDPLIYEAFRIVHYLKNEHDI